ncbi:MAG TPA: NDP-sugar synthase [Acidimicrobiales bacterium]|nr:NDP-sugar synthase [Acidimicrobiales bacterium]
MQAVVLVGGLGTRLRPLTETIPKQLLPVAGVPMIERVLGQLASHGVDRAVLSMGYLPDAFVASYPDGRIGGVSVSFAIEPVALGTAGAIRFAGLAGSIGETFLAVNGDVLTDLDITALIDAHRSRGAEGTIHLTPVDDPTRYGVVVTDATGLVTSFVEKPEPGTSPSNNINAGTYVLEPSFFERIADAAMVSVEREIFPRMVHDRSLYAMVDRSYWIDAGTPQAFLRANKDILDGTRTAPHPGALSEGALVLEGASVAASATISGSVLGRNVRVGEGASIVDSVVLEGATIGNRASVTDAVIGPDAVIGADATLLDNCLIGASEQVPERERRSGTARAT